MRSFANRQTQSLHAPPAAGDKNTSAAKNGAADRIFGRRFGNSEALSGEGSARFLWPEVSHLVKLGGEFFFSSQQRVHYVGVGGKGGGL